MTCLRSVAFQLLFYMATVVVSVVSLPLLALPRAATLWMVRGWCGLTLWLLRWVVGLDYEVLGRENVPAGPVIYAVKHQSAWEALVMPLLVPDPAIVLKRELLFVPMFGWYLLRVGMIPVDRAGGSRALKRMLAAARRAQAAGRPVVVFPEGTRTAPGAAGAYQPGVAALYRALDAPVVPVALNSGVFWPPRAFVLRPGRITLRFLPPIPPGLKRPEFMTTLHDRIEIATRRLEAPGAASELSPSAPAKDL